MPDLWQPKSERLATSTRFRWCVEKLDGTVYSQRRGFRSGVRHPIWFASKEAAQRKADELNRRDAQQSV